MTPVLPLVAENALVLYFTNTHGLKTSYPALDSISRHGCNGALAAVASDKASTTCFEHVLGASIEGIDHSVLKTHEVAYSILTTSLRNSTTEYVSAQNLPKKIMHHLQLTKRRIVLVHLDLSEYNESIDQIVALQQDPVRFCLVAIIRETIEMPLPSCLLPVGFPMPKQSWEKRHSKYVASTKNTSWLTYSLYLDQQTRRDQVMAWNEVEILSRGGYGFMQAPVALEEIAFRLGYVPKYGA